MTEVHICREIQHLRDFAFFEKKSVPFCQKLLFSESKM